jgi:hypothetical protein
MEVDKGSEWCRDERLTLLGSNHLADRKNFIRQKPNFLASFMHKALMVPIALNKRL